MKIKKENKITKNSISIKSHEIFCLCYDYFIRMGPSHRSDKNDRKFQRQIEKIIKRNLFE